MLHSPSPPGVSPLFLMYLFFCLLVLSIYVCLSLMYVFFMYLYFLKKTRPRKHLAQFCFDRFAFFNKAVSQSCAPDLAELLQSPFCYAFLFPIKMPTLIIDALFCYHCINFNFHSWSTLYLSVCLFSRLINRVLRYIMHSLSGFQTKWFSSVHCIESFGELTLCFNTSISVLKIS